MSIRLLLTILAAASTLPWGGCSKHRTVRSEPVAATAPAAANVARAELGVELSQPAGWFAQPSSEYVLLLRPAGMTGDALPALSLDVPELPFHIPGLIPIGAVRSGYLDDLRKQVGPLAVEDLPPPDIGGATARLVRSTWQPAPGRVVRETALLLVHDDRVYILRGRSDAAHEGQTRAAFDAIVRSWRWVKPGK